MLAIIFLALSSSTILWALKDKTPPAWDPSDHMSMAYDYYRPLAHLDIPGFAHEFFFEPHFYAPFVHLVMASVFLALGASQLAALAVNLISLALLLASVAWLGNLLYSRAPDEAGSAPPRTSPGLLAALLASCYHFPAWLVHDAFLDYPLTTMVAVTFGCLIKAGEFRSRRYALLFGTAAGLGMLTKQSFAFFFLLPALYVCLRVLLARDRRAILNLALAAAVAAGLALIWYIPHLQDVLEIYRVNKEAALNENEAPLFSLGSNLFYVHALLSTQMQVPFGLLFLFGLFYSLIRYRRQSIMLYLWLASGIGMFTFIANKDVRYTVPVLPAAALLSVCWLGYRAPRPSKPQKKLSAERGGAGRAFFALKGLVVTAIIVWAFISFFNSQWPKPGTGLYIDTPRFRWMVFARNYYGFDHRPLPDDWSIPDIVNAVVRHRHQDQPPALASRALSVGGADAPAVGVVVNLPYLNPSTLGLYARLLSPGRAGPPLLKPDWLVVDSARDRIDSCQYLLVRSGLDRAEWVAPIEKYAEELIRANPGRFIQVATFPIPLDRAEAILYWCAGPEAKVPAVRAKLHER